MKTLMFPGQGSQYKGMGKELFQEFRNETSLASDILGFDLEELCVNDPHKKLGKTQFTQPALFAVNAFNFYKIQDKIKPDFLIGHSLGEYNALLAAGVFDFETGLRLVKKRGELMGAASGGGMAAVLGINAEELKEKLHKGNYLDIDVANYNTPSQIVIAGPSESINKVVKDFESLDIKVVPLFVSAPFHSRYMSSAANEFSDFLNEFTFSPIQVPVISNVSARPYEYGRISELLSTQISSSVNWIDTIRYLMGKEVQEYQEIGGAILGKMVVNIKENCTPLINIDKTIIVKQKILNETVRILANENKLDRFSLLSMQLGSKEFRQEYNLQYSYMTGAMYRGIASKEMVVSVGKAGMLGSLGTGGMSIKEIGDNIEFIKKNLINGESYALNLLHNLMNPNLEMETVKLYLNEGVRIIEAAAFMQITKSLVYFRLSGLRKDENGQIISDNKIIAKISRPEVAEEFMRPASQRIVNSLLEEGLITSEQAALSQHIPMSHDVCVEADSGGHTDGGVALVLLPSIQSLRAEIQEQYNYVLPIRVGLGGGIGTPQSVTCAFVMGADFVLTGSINQCTVEAGTSDAVKDLLQEINVQDTAYAPAGDMFEIGAKVQVLKKGVLFPARANKLYALFSQYNSLEEIPDKVIEQLEKNYFKKSINTIWEETRVYLQRRGDEEGIVNAEKNPKQKMALIFRWYFGNTSRFAFEGNLENKLNFQIHTGPALGAFNQWVKGSEMENWRFRNVDKIGKLMMKEAAVLLERQLLLFNSFN